jgi:hypothetical protein
VVELEAEEPGAVLEREMVFALSGEVKETGGLVPGVRGVVELGGGREVIIPAASVCLKAGGLQSTRYSRITMLDAL